MAKSNFDNEIKSSMNEQPKGNKPSVEDADKKPPQLKQDGGEGKPAQGPMMPRAGQVNRPSLGNVSQPMPEHVMPPHTGPGPGLNQAMGPPDAHHVAAAAGIAHAILGNRGIR